MRKTTMLALVVSGATLAMAGQALAQTPVLYDGYKPVKNALGQPDLTGVWDYATITPFERAAAHGARALPAANLLALHVLSAASRCVRGAQNGTRADVAP